MQTSFPLMLILKCGSLGLTARRKHLLYTIESKINEHFSSFSLEKEIWYLTQLYGETIMTNFFKPILNLSICALLCTSSFAEEKPAQPAQPAQPAEKAAKEKQMKELQEALGSLKLDLQSIKPDAVVGRVGDKTFTAEEFADAI